MNCVCGGLIQHPLDPCSSCGLVQKDCPGCGVQFAVVEEAIVPSCPLCITPFQQDVECEVGYFPVHVASADVPKCLERFVLNRFGIPKDFSVQYSVSKTELVYVPIRTYSVEAWLASNICEVDTLVCPLHTNLWYESYLSTHRFSLRSKVLLPQESNSIVYSKDVSEAVLAEEVEAFGKAIAKADRSWFSPGTNQPLIQSEVLSEELYPLYEIEYRYGDQTYKAVVDASNGVVCCAGYPIIYEARARLLISAVLMLGLTVLLAFIFGTTHISNFSDVAGVNVFIIGLMVSARLLYTSLKRPVGQEVTANPSSKLDLTGMPLSLYTD